MKDATNFAMHLGFMVLALWLCTIHLFLGAFYFDDLPRTFCALNAAVASAWIVVQMYGHCHRYGRQIVIQLWRAEQNQRALREALDGTFDRVLSNGHGKAKRRA